MLSPHACTSNTETVDSKTDGHLADHPCSTATKPAGAKELAASRALLAAAQLDCSPSKAATASKINSVPRASKEKDLTMVPALSRSLFSCCNPAIYFPRDNEEGRDGVYSTRNSGFGEARLAIGCQHSDEFLVDHCFFQVFQETSTKLRVSSVFRKKPPPPTWLFLSIPENSDAVLVLNGDIAILLGHDMHTPHLHGHSSKKNKIKKNK